MARQPAFIHKQYAFAAHIRNPQLHPCPNDISARRMKIYSDLFYNNVEDFVSNSYPVLRQILNDHNWHRLIRDYFHTHQASTPLFPQMPREFLHYLQNERQADKTDYPFMLELAHYEWTELALSISTQEPDLTQIDSKADLLHGLPIISPLAWPLSYHWPVHQIGADYLPDTPPETMTHLLLYRDTQDAIHFMQLNPVTTRLLQLIKQQTLTSAKAMLQQISTELNHPDPQTVIQAGLSILQDLLQRQVILGVSQHSHQ